MRPSPTPRQQPLPRNPPGFTLIELLVVILVLG
ncbi:MAG: prepilin-type N-terminal cleavage/methylation domain-containing protein, partial [Limisphaerales bacterium]